MKNIISIILNEMIKWFPMSVCVLLPLTILLSPTGWGVTISTIIFGVLGIITCRTHLKLINNLVKSVHKLRIENTQFMFINLENGMKHMFEKMEREGMKKHIKELEEKLKKKDEQLKNKIWPPHGCLDVQDAFITEKKQNKTVKK